MQQHLIETSAGRLQPLQIAWNTREGHWFHLLPNEKATPGDVLHWSGRYQTANTMCIGCHTTGFDKRDDATACSGQPGIGELQYSRGLLLAEQQRLPDAADALNTAAKLLPQRARAFYNLGLARQQLGQPKAAEAALRRARELAPTDPAIAYALVVFYAQQGRRADALREAEALQQLQPGNP